MSKHYAKSPEFTTLEVKRSKFISHIIPYDLFDTYMERLKEDHPKARHIVYAYRYINEFDQIVENLSDDGEPKGSAGKPTLAAMRGAELVNTAIITVRYFGGIKLGVGGMIRAYSDSANLSIDNGDLVPYKKLAALSFEVSYSNLAKCEHILKTEELFGLNKDFGADGVTVEFNIAEDRVSDIKLALKDFILS